MTASCPVCGAFDEHLHMDFGRGLDGYVRLLDHILVKHPHLMVAQGMYPRRGEIRCACGWRGVEAQAVGHLASFGADLGAHFAECRLAERSARQFDDNYQDLIIRREMMHSAGVIQPSQGFRIRKV